MTLTAMRLGVVSQAKMRTEQGQQTAHFKSFQDIVRRHGRHSALFAVQTISLSYLASNYTVSPSDGSPTALCA